MTHPRHPCSSDPGARRTVLLVEDEPFVREATCRTLQSVGFEVLLAADAQEAMKVYEHSERKIDLLMTDLVLPGRSGRQLGQDLRSASPEIPILLTSGYVEPEAVAPLPEPSTYYLAKPYSQAELVGKIKEILDPSVRRRAASHSG